MNEQLTRFISDKCLVVPPARTKLVDLYRGFLAWLPAEQRALWSRTAFVVEIASRFAVGANADGVTTIGGLALKNTKRWIRGSDGRLRLVEVETTQTDG